MSNSHKIELTNLEHEEGHKVFTLSVDNKEYKIYAFDSDIPSNDKKRSTEYLTKFAKGQMLSWIKESDGNTPKDKYRVLVNGGKITTDNIKSFFSIKKKSSGLARTNITISAPLLEWSRVKAQKEGTSFSDLVSRGLMMLKESEKEIGAWLKEQGSYFRKKLGSYGSLEVFHYLPNNYTEFSTEALKNALQDSEINRTGWPIGVYLTGGDNKPKPQEDGIKAEYTDSPHLLLDYWYAKNLGEFYFSRSLDSDSGHGKAEPKTSLYFDTLIWRVAESIEHCLAYYKNLDIEESEKVKLRISLYGLKNRTLSAWNPGRASTLRRYTCGSDKSTWETEMSLHVLKKDLDDVIYEVVKKLLIMFDFFVPNKEVVFSILEKEYRKSSFS